jgi:hypothetical protein
MAKHTFSMSDVTGDTRILARSASDDIHLSRCYANSDTERQHHTSLQFQTLGKINPL